MARYCFNLNLLVAVPSQSIMDCPQKLRLKHGCTTQLTYLLGRLADREMAGASFAMLGFAGCG